jgi:thiol:disulfide interchange protein
MLLAGLLIGAALILQWQWPWVKGLYYQAAGTEAPPSTIPWRDSFDSAMAEVKASDKPLLVVFSASWCPACIAMKHDVWPDSDVSEAVTNGFVPLFVDVDEPRHAPVVARYGGQSVPVFVVVDRDGEILRHESWLMSRSKILTFLDSKVR